MPEAEEGSQISRLTDLQENISTVKLISYVVLSKSSGAAAPQPHPFHHLWAILNG